MNKADLKETDDEIISRLEAENAELRKAVKEAASICENQASDPSINGFLFDYWKRRARRFESALSKVTRKESED